MEEIKTTEVQPIKNPVWVFQFDNEDPIPFAFYNSPEEGEEEGDKILTIKLDGSTTGNPITFVSPSGKVLKLFATENEIYK